MEIALLEPENDIITEPLQQYCWPLDSNKIPAAAEQTLVPVVWEDGSNTEEVDHSMPLPITFRWQKVLHNCDDLRYDFHLADNATFQQPRLIKNVAEPYLKICNLHIGTRYFWKVTARCKEEIVAESPIGTLTTHEATPRWIMVPGTTNVRDMGGWPLLQGGRIRQGMIYRSAELNRRVKLTAEGERVLLEELQLRTDIDLREDKETPAAALSNEQVSWINIPTYMYGGIEAENEYGKSAFCKIFQLLAQAESYPLIFHCGAGADRAGTVAFLIGALLGMSPEDLIKDYELTSLSIWQPRDHQEEPYLGLLRVLKKFGGETLTVGQQVEQYLTEIGVTAKEIAAIRNILIEKPIPTKKNHHEQ